MAILIDMPKLSDTMEEGGIAEWFVKEGDLVSEGDLLVAIETDKATMEYSSPEDGTLLKILVNIGDTVPLNKPIAVFGKKGESFDLNKLLASKNSTQESSKAEEKPSSVESNTTKVEASNTAQSTSTRIIASPLAKKVAAEKGLNLENISGSGPRGRIVVSDLENVQASTQKIASPSLTRPSSFAADEKIPLSMMRKTIAKRLLIAKNDAPHFYLNVSANMDNVIEWRKELNKNFDSKSKDQVKVSINDIIIMATAKALRLHPQVNSSWHNDYILQHGSVDVSMAVALPTGLITPIIHNADQLGVRQIAVSSKSLAGKAKQGQLSPEEYEGGSFTISNLGMTKVESFTAIINPPQACILAVGCSKDELYLAKDGTVKTYKRMEMTMSCDHRVVDGMVGAQFLETLVSFLESPLLMLS